MGKGSGRPQLAREASVIHGCARDHHGQLSHLLAAAACQCLASMCVERERAICLILVDTSASGWPQGHNVRALRCLTAVHMHKA